MFEEIEYIDIARTRYTDQFKNSVNFDLLMLIWMFGFQDLQEEFIGLLDIKDVDKAKGVQLDIIGEIVGQPRTLESIDATGFFGFQSDPGAQPFGTLTDGSGGIYNSLYESGSAGTISLPDGSYRAFIKAKILSNNAGGTPEEVIAAAQALFSTDYVELLNDVTESGVFSLYIGRPWNDPDGTAFPGLDETVLAERLLPKPVGVRIEYIDVAIGDTIAAVDNFESAANYLFSTVNVSLYETIGDDKF